MKRKMIALLAGVFASISLAIATEVELRPDYPEVYVVQRGDTLWDISEQFLKSPWLWPRLWQANPHVDNPHLIYPGDELSLVWFQGEPKVVRTKKSNTKIVKLGPRVRTSEPKSPIPTIPLNKVRQFLSYEQVLSEEDLQSLPYILGNNDHTVSSVTGQSAYAKGIDATQGERIYGVYRPGKELIDPETGESLGFQAVLAGIGKVSPAGEYARLEITDSRYEIRNGDKLIPVLEREVLPAFFHPHEPERLIKAAIIHGANRAGYMGKYDVVAINKGSQDGVEQGHVLAINKNGAVVHDNPPDNPEYDESASQLDKWLSDFGDDPRAQLPDERAGEMIVFRVYDRVSYGLVMRSDRPIQLLDKVTNP